MLMQLKSLSIGRTTSGDGRHDSMDHSAKYCAYTIFSGDNTEILHFSLVQVNCCIVIKLSHFLLFSNTVVYYFVGLKS